MQHHLAYHKQPPSDRLVSLLLLLPGLLLELQCWRGEDEGHELQWIQQVVWHVKTPGE